MLSFFNYSSELLGLSEFPSWFGFASIHSTISGHVISVACEFKYLLVISSVALIA